MKRFGTYEKGVVSKVGNFFVIQRDWTDGAFVKLNNESRYVKDKNNATVFASKKEAILNTILNETVIRIRYEYRWHWVVKCGDQYLEIWPTANNTDKRLSGYRLIHWTEERSKATRFSRDGSFAIRRKLETIGDDAIVIRVRVTHLTFHGRVTRHKWTFEP